MNGRLLVKSTLETRLSSNVKSGPTSKGACRTFSTQPQAAQAAAREQDVETGGPGAEHAKDERAAALRRLRGRAARSRDREERDGDRRGEGYSASHQFSAFARSRPRLPTFLNVARNARWPAADRAGSRVRPCQLASALFSTRARCSRRESGGLVQVGRDEPLAVPRDVVAATAAIDARPRARTRLNTRTAMSIAPRVDLGR